MGGGGPGRRARGVVPPFGFLKNLTIGLIWLVGGEAWGVWAGRRARGGRWGGGTREQCGSNKGVHWFHLFSSLSNLTIGLIWLVTV